MIYHFQRCVTLSLNINESWKKCLPAVEGYIQKVSKRGFVWDLWSSISYQMQIKKQNIWKRFDIKMPDLLLSNVSKILMIYLVSFLYWNPFKQKGFLKITSQSPGLRFITRSDFTLHFQIHDLPLWQPGKAHGATFKSARNVQERDSFAPAWNPPPKNNKIVLFFSERISFRRNDPLERRAALGLRSGRKSERPPSSPPPPPYRRDGDYLTRWVVFVVLFLLPPSSCTVLRV